MPKKNLIIKRKRAVSLKIQAVYRECARQFFFYYLLILKNHLTLNSVHNPLVSSGTEIRNMKIPPILIQSEAARHEVLHTFFSKACEKKNTKRGENRERGNCWTAKKLDHSLVYIGANPGRIISPNKTFSF